MDYTTVPSTCLYCGAGCGLLFEVVDGQVVGTLPSVTHPISRGALCIKGWAAHEIVHHPRRLTAPLVRDGTQFRQATWDEALGLVAAKLTEVRQRHGPDAIGVISSAKCTNEENFLTMKFARAVIGTNNVDHCARLCHAPSVTGLAQAFGSGAMTNSIGELESAECVLVTGSNTTEAHPLIGTRLLRAKEAGATLIVVDPRKIQLAAYADLHLRQAPGTDVAWINGLIHVILEEGWADEQFIASRTEGFEDLQRAVEAYDPQTVEELTGIPAEGLRSAARLFATADKAAIVYCLGITQHTTGTHNVIALANLAMVTGNVGKANTGVNPLRGQQNVQGACDMGALPNVLSGYQKVDDEQARAKFEQAWGVELPGTVGLTLCEMIEAAARGEIRALYVIGQNPMVANPDITQVKAGLEKLEMLVVQEMFPTATTDCAHVILPAASFAEKDGTFTSSERRVQRIRQAIAPLDASRPDWEIICDLAQRMGGRGFDYAGASEIFDEIAGLTPTYGGMDYERLGAHGLQWPCRSADDLGTMFLHAGEFPRGRGRLIPLEYLPPAEMPDEQYPFVLTTGRCMFLYDTMTGVSPSLDAEVPEGYVEISEEDARQLGVKDDEMIKITSRRGTVDLRARVGDIVPSGVVFAPFHFAHNAANLLTTGARDPQAKIPQYKCCAVRLERPNDD